MEIKIESKIKLDSNGIIGVFDSSNYLISYLKKINFTKNNIVLNGKKQNQEELMILKKKIGIVDTYILDDYLNLSVYEYMKNYICDNILDIKDYRKKIVDSLKIVGLGESYLDKKISRLSKCEGIWINFATKLLSNPDIIVFHQSFSSFDLKNKKKMIRLMQQLVDVYHKIVVIDTTNVESIYEFSRYTIILKDSDVLLEGNTDVVFQDNYELLLENKIPIPKSIEFSSKVNRHKNIKLGYFKDIRDLIKDIYKKV